MQRAYQRIAAEDEIKLRSQLRNGEGRRSVITDSLLCSHENMIAPLARLPTALQNEKEEEDVRIY